jgi:hypothetical protein
MADYVVNYGGFSNPQAAFSTLMENVGDVME